jgi:hypothetical protein
MSQDLTTIGADRAARLIRVCMAKKRPVFIWGPPGIGKSELIEQIGEKESRPVIDMRMLLLDPTDVKGIPYYNVSKNTMEWAPPGELPTLTTDADIANAEERLATLQGRVDAEVLENLSATEQLALERAVSNAEENLKQILSASEMQNAILFLDELVAAPPSVQAAAYQLILNRRVGQYHLPDGIDMIAAGNRETDKAVSYKMPTPLANRFIHLEMEADFDSWQKWAINKNVHPDVVGYLSDKKQDLMSFDPKNVGKAFATPRSWVFVSDLLYAQREFQLDDFDLGVLIEGTIGPGLKIEFMNHLKYSARLPRVEDVLTGKVKKLEKEVASEISAHYALTVGMCYELQRHYKLVDDSNDTNHDSKTLHEAADYYFEFIMENFKQEMCVLGAQTLLREYGVKFKPGKMKNFTKFHAKFGEYIIDND